MKAAYDACLDETTIKQLGVAPLTDIVSGIKKRLPVTGTLDEGAVVGVILALAKYGISTVVAPGTGADDTDPDTVVVSVSPPWRIGLPSKERYLDEKLVQKYQDVVSQVLSKLSPEQDKETFSKVVDFEKKLAAASPSTEEREDVTVSNHAPSWSIYLTNNLVEIIQPNVARRGGGSRTSSWPSQTHSRPCPCRCGGDSRHCNVSEVLESTL